MLTSLILLLYISLYHSMLPCLFFFVIAFLKSLFYSICVATSTFLSSLHEISFYIIPFSVSVGSILKGLVLLYNQPPYVLNEAFNLLTFKVINDSYVLIDNLLLVFWLFLMVLLCLLLPFVSYLAVWSFSLVVCFFLFVFMHILQVLNWCFPWGSYMLIYNYIYLFKLAIIKVETHPKLSTLFTPLFQVLCF